MLFKILSSFEHHKWKYEQAIQSYATRSQHILSKYKSPYMGWRFEYVTILKQQKSWCSYDIDFQLAMKMPYYILMYWERVDSVTLTSKYWSSADTQRMGPTISDVP